MGMQDQVLREIDKWDKVGAEGVRARLTTGLTDSSGAQVPGVGLHPVQADAIIAFIDQRFGAGVEGMERWFDLVGTRLQLIVGLDQMVIRENGYTAWDSLIDAPTNADNTWSTGRRPENIGWALDDIACLVRAFRKANTAQQQNES